jgi:hypothetical protein
MPNYQLFFLTSEDKAVRKLEQSFDNDAAALQEARGFAIHHTIHIWQNIRRVATIAPGALPLIFSAHRTP